MPDGHGHLGDSADTITLSIPAQKQCRVLVVGNEKGGAGKSTVSIHLAIALMRMDQKVGVIDLDVRQRTLTRYLENRMRWMQSTGAQLPMPEINSVAFSDSLILPTGVPVEPLPVEVLAALTYSSIPLGTLPLVMATATLREASVLEPTTEE